MRWHQRYRLYLITAEERPLNGKCRNTCAGADPACAGTKTYTFTYTDCVVTNTYQWVYTYTFSPSPVVRPLLPCLQLVLLQLPVSADAVAPTAPTVPTLLENLTVSSGGPVCADPACAGTKTYTFTFTECDNTTLPVGIYLYHLHCPVLPCLQLVLLRLPVLLMQ